MTLGACERDVGNGVGKELLLTGARADAGEKGRSMMTTRISNQYISVRDPWKRQEHFQLQRNVLGSVLISRKGRSMWFDSW